MSVVTHARACGNCGSCGRPLLQTVVPNKASPELSLCLWMAARVCRWCHDLNLLAGGYENPRLSERWSEDELIELHKVAAQVMAQRQRPKMRRRRKEKEPTQESPQGAIPTGFGVAAIKTEKRCKLCASAERVSIDLLLEKRSKGEMDSAGVRVNGEYVLRRLVEFGVVNPTIDNLKGHWKNHCQIITEEEKSAKDAALQAVADGLRERIASGERINPDEVLSAILAQGMAEMEMKVLLDGKVGITVDQLLKAVDSMTKRKSNEATDELLRQLGGGIGMVFEKALSGPSVAGELPEVVEDVEYVEVADAS